MRGRRRKRVARIWHMPTSPGGSGGGTGDGALGLGEEKGGGRRRSEKTTRISAPPSLRLGFRRLQLERRYI